MWAAMPSAPLEEVNPRDRLRPIRAIATLEWAGSTAARALLREWAAGDSLRAREAKAALRRLAVQPGGDSRPSSTSRQNAGMPR
jgi:hypothetical protein